MIRHVGIRPKYPTHQVKLQYRYEYYQEEEVTGKIWTARELKSGCGEIVQVLKTLGDCIYCAHCDEWFNKKQFKEVEE